MMDKTFDDIIYEYLYADVVSPRLPHLLQYAHEKGLLPGILAEAGLQEFGRGDQSGLFPMLHRGLDRLQKVLERARLRMSA